LHQASHGGENIFLGEDISFAIGKASFIDICGTLAFVDAKVKFFDNPK